MFHGVSHYKNSQIEQIDGKISILLCYLFGVIIRQVLFQFYFA